jgi:hypothetical protein
LERGSLLNPHPLCRARLLELADSYEQRGRFDLRAIAWAIAENFVVAVTDKTIYV